MALRSRISSIKTSDPAETADADPKLAPDDVQSGNLPARGAIHEPAATAAEIPDGIADPRPEAGNAAPEKKTRAKRGTGIAKKTRVVNPPVTGTAPQIRAQLKELDGKIKGTRKAHEVQLKALRSQQKVLQDRLFDLTK